MSEVKIEIKKTGKLFHYAHFICDVLFPEVNMHLYNYKTIYVRKDIEQTIGIFKKIFEEIMGNKYEELYPGRFAKMDCELKIVNRFNFLKVENFLFFRKYIWDKLGINFDKNYPEIILIERGNHIELVDDKYLKNLNFDHSNGKEKREIVKINELKIFMQNNFGKKYKCVILEDTTFIEQVKLFFNAKIIIAIHGGALANMFFCKSGTKVLEILGERKWRFFDVISKNLNLIHKKCENNLETIKNNIINI